DNCTAVSICPPNNGNIVVAKDTNSVTVVPISLECTTTLFSSLDLSNGLFNVTLPPDTSNAPISVTVTIHNTGSGDLNLSILGLPPLVSCIDDTTTVTVPTIFVGAGQTVTTNLGCEIVSCPGVTNNIKVVGTAVSSVSHPCVLDITGTPIQTAESQCPATVCC